MIRSDGDRVWSCLLELSRRASKGRPLAAAVMDADDSGRVQVRAWDGASAGAGFLRVDANLAGGYASAQPLDPQATLLLQRYLPLVTGPDSAQLVVAHLGQSADGYAATFCGTTKFITGEEDIRHTHRMRALFDAIVVGASTVAIDDPLLTTRMVAGASPLRVVLDPQARLRPDHQVFRERSARTLVVTAVTAPDRAVRLPAHVESLPLPCAATGLPLEQLLLALRQRGAPRVFIEGGQFTIHHFLRARLLHRLQLAVAPVILGPGPALPAHRLSPRTLLALGRTRRFNLGRDALFETELRERASTL